MKAFWWGLAALVIAWGQAIILINVVINSAMSGDEPNATGILMASTVFSLIAMAAAIIAIVLGVRALFGSDERKLMAVFGVVFGLLAAWRAAPAILFSGLI